MANKKDRYSFGIFQDGLNIKVAQLACNNGVVRIQKLEEIELNYPLYLKESMPEPEFDDSAEFSLPDISDQEEFALPELEEFDTADTLEEITKEEAITGISELEKFLLKFKIDRGRLAINANDEQISYHVFDSDFASGNLKKKMRAEYLSKDEIKHKNYSMDYIINPDKSGLAFVHRGRFELLDALQEINPTISKKNFYYGFIDTNEIALMNMVRANYEFPEDEFVLILYIGIDYKVGIVMRGKNHVRTFPLIVPESDPVTMRQAIYSKVMLEQETSNTIISQNVVLAGDYVTDEDFDFYVSKTREGQPPVRLELINSDIILEDGISYPKDKMARFAIPIAMAWRSMHPRYGEFYKCNLLPSRIIEGQKYFKIGWHGFVVMALIFFFALSGTTKNLELNQELEQVRQLNKSIEVELRENRGIIAKLNQVKTELTALQENLKKITELTGTKNQWHYILTMLSDTMKNNKISWISNLRGDEKAFEVTGYSTQRRHVIDFSKMFPDGKITSISEHDIEDIPIWEFRISFSYPNPDDILKEKSADIHITEVVQKETKQVAQPASQPEPTPPQVQPADDIYGYEVQLLASTDFAQVEALKQTVEQAGYSTKTTLLTNNGTTIYRLRMDATLPQPEAIALGEKVRTTIPAVREYWIDTVKQSEVADEPPVQEGQTSSAVQPVSTSYRDLVNLYYKGRYQQAVEGFTHTLADQPTHPHRYTIEYLMGECYYQLGQINNAVDKFTTIEAQRGSKHPDALIMLGNCYYKIGDYEQAKTYWNTLISSYPSNKLTRIAQRKVAKLEN